MKHGFIERGDTFTIISDEKHTYTCKDFKTEVTFNLDSGVYRPDIVVETVCGNEFVFEMAHKNKKKVQDYIDRWIELDKIVVEVDTPTLTGQNEVKEFKALYFKGKCFNFNKRDGGYYNAIGKLKEEMKQNGKYDIELVRKLDWFWDELISKNNNEELFNGYDTLNKDVKEFIKCNTSSKCTSFIQEYLNYKIEYLTNVVNEYCGEINLKNRNKLAEVSLGYKDYVISFMVDLIGDSNHDIHSVIQLKYSMVENSYGVKLEFFKFDEYLKSINKYLQFRYEKYDGTLSEILDIEYKYKHVLSLKCDENILTMNRKELLPYLKEVTRDFLKNNAFSENLQLLHTLKNVNEVIRFINVDHYYTYKSKRKYGHGFRWVNNNATVNVHFYYKIEYYTPSIHEIKLIENNREDKTLFSKTVYGNETISEQQLLTVALDAIQNNIEWLCKDCRDLFSLNDKELKFYIDKGFELPKRCKSCRQKRKQLK